MDSKKFQEILDKYLQGKCSDEEKKFINDWYNSIPVDNRNQRDKMSESMVERRMWANIQQSLSEDSLKSKRLNRKLKWFLNVAAAALILFGLLTFYVFSRQDPRTRFFADTDALVEFANPTAQPQALKLQDGSEILLHPNSTVSYKRIFDPSKREVFLSGKAFFTISKDANRPFYVYTQEVTTKVLGTSFLVKAYEDDDEVSVRVRTGKVSVYASSPEVVYFPGKAVEEIILTPNQQVVINAGTEKVERMLVKDPEIIVDEVLPRVIEYQNASVIDILEQIERSYGIEIRYDKTILSNCRLTTTFSDEGFYERLEIISTAINSTYRKTDTHIQIISKSCLNK